MRFHPSQTVLGRMGNALGRGGWRLGMLVGLIALIQFAVLGRTAWLNADTWDEPDYLVRAATLADEKAILGGWMAMVPYWSAAATMWLYDPSFAKVPETAKLKDAPDTLTFSTRMQSMFWSRSYQDMRTLLWMARLSSILATVIAGVALFAAGKVISVRMGLLAQLLWAFSPTVLASGFQFIIDGWCGATVCFLLWATVRAVVTPSSGRWAVWGLFAAVALATKVTTTPVVGTSFLIACWAARPTAADGWRRFFLLWRPAFGLGSSFLIALWVLTMFDVAWAFGGKVPIPFGSFVMQMFIEGAERGLAGGDINYLFGNQYVGARKEFYAAAVALRTTVAAQALAVVALGGLLWRRPTRDETIYGVFLAVPVCFTFAVMSMGSFQPNISFLLPIFPVGIWGIAYLLDRAVASWGFRASIVTSFLCALAVAESLAAHPHHQMFLNVWGGGPARLPEYFIERDDWGQGRRELGEWQEKNGLDRIFYAPFTGPYSSLTAWKIRAELNVPCLPTVGVYALHAAVVRTGLGASRGCFDWLTQEPPDEVLGHAIYIYRVDEKRRARLQRGPKSAPPFFEMASRKEVSATIQSFTAEARSETEVLLRWESTSKTGVLALDHSSPDDQQMAGFSEEPAGSMIVPRNANGLYALLVSPGYVSAPANISGAALSGNIWTVKGGIATLHFGALHPPSEVSANGQVLYHSDAKNGTFYAAPEKTTEYVLKTASGATATAVVRVPELPTHKARQ
jgi:hypothetical protein